MSVLNIPAWFGQLSPVSPATVFSDTLTPIAVSAKWQAVQPSFGLTSVGLTNTALWNDAITLGKEQSASWQDFMASTPQTLSPITWDDARTSPFRRVYTDYLVPGNSRIHWELRPQYSLTPPLTFQLQVGATAGPNADDWTNVGPPVVNGSLAFDPNKRDLGKLLTTHYRVILTDGGGKSYTSPPATVLGQLGVREWIWARECIRRERLRLKKWAGVNGFILKRRRTGTPCPVCLDPSTGLVTNSKCPVCKGTRLVTGYFAAIPSQFVELTPLNYAELRDTSGPTGQVGPMVSQGRFLGEPQLATNDVWIDGASGLRYWVETIEVIASTRNVPLVLEAKLMSFPFDHIIYTVPMEGN